MKVKLTDANFEAYLRRFAAQEFHAQARNGQDNELEYARTPGGFTVSYGSHIFRVGNDFEYVHELHEAVVNGVRDSLG